MLFNWSISTHFITVTREVTILWVSSISHPSQRDYTLEIWIPTGTSLSRSAASGMNLNQSSGVTQSWVVWTWISRVAWVSLQWISLGLPTVLSSGVGLLSVEWRESARSSSQWISRVAWISLQVNESVEWLISRVLPGVNRCSSRSLSRQSLGPRRQPDGLINQSVCLTIPDHAFEFPMTIGLLHLDRRIPTNYNPHSRDPAN